MVKTSVDVSPSDVKYRSDGPNYASSEAPHGRNRRPLFAPHSECTWARPLLFLFDGAAFASAESR
jgi:hypothetical protein